MTLDRTSSSLHFFAGGGECGSLMRGIDWASHSLGPPQSWPQSLKTLVGVMLTSNQPMLIVWGPSLTTLYNDGYAAMCGQRHPAALGHGFDQLWFDLWDQVGPILSKAYAGEATQMDDITFTMHRNGYPEETHFAFSYTPVRSDDGSVSGMFCACTETTRQVFAERQLAAEQERQRLLLQQMPGFVALLHGPAHVFDYVNDAYVRIAGQRDFVGRSVREVFPELEGQGFYELLDDVYATGRAFHASSLPIRFSGEPDNRYIDFIYEPIRSDDGPVIGVFVGGYDVTERVRAETSLQQLTETLEQRVQERTHERDRQAEALAVTEAALRQSQKMEAVGQLTGGIAHDFNNLLTGITGSLELMQRRVAQGRGNEVERYVNAAMGAARRAAALTHRLLAFSRRQTLDPKSADLNRLVHGMEELVRRTVGPEIEVQTVAAGGLWSTLVDVSQLENALLNLCINARDAMPTGGRLTIETANKWLDARAAAERDVAPGQYVTLSVSDTGSGMTPEVIAKAFDPFFTTKPIGLGTGLGLSMIYGFVRQSEGQVRIYSEVDRGTTVSLYLPRHLGESEQAEAAPGPADAPRAVNNETVLVVDDEPTVRMLVVEVLEDLGYTALEAVDGASGLKLLASPVRVDLLVTDVGLPNGINGRQLADAARAVRPELTVLFITGYAENAVLNHGHLDHGMHVLTKPFAMGALARRIRELIEAG